MKQYLRTVISAILGRNPFQAEMEEVRSRYERTAENVCTLNALYDKCAEKMESDAGVISQLQALIEVLRQRLDEKDKLADRMKKEYQSRIDRYTEEIDQLKKKIQP